MRAYIIAAAAALALAACQKTEPAAEVAATPAPAAEAPAHDMATMDHDMSTADAADDANTAETPDGFTFHTYPAKTESVHLPVGNWTAIASDALLVAVGAAADEAMPDGATHHVVKVDTKASGNADVKFERRETADAAAPVVETRTIHFMIH